MEVRSVLEVVPTGRQADARVAEQAFRRGVHNAGDTAVSVSLEQARRNLADARHRYSVACGEHGEHHPATAEQRGRVAGYEIALEALDGDLSRWRMTRWVRILEEWSQQRGRYASRNDAPSPWTC